MKKLAIICTIIVSTTILAGCGGKESGDKTQGSNTPKTEQSTIQDESKNPDDVKDDEKESEKKNEKLFLKVYSYDAETDKINSEDVKVDKIDENVILNQLISKGMIEKGVKINKATKNGNVLTVDFDKNILNSNLGGGVEKSTLDAIANTFIDGMNVQKLRITINGKNYESGHISLKDDDYFTKEQGNQKETLKIYSYDAESDKIKSEDIKVDKVDSDVILNQLISKGMIEKGSKINKVDKKDGTLTIDFNKNIIGTNVGSGVEGNRLQAVANTFIDGLKVNKFKITIKGENYKSGHVEFGENDYFTKK